MGYNRLNTSPVAFTSPWEATVPAGPAGGEQIHLMWSVYAIRSSIDGRIYVGMSQDVARRISEHNRRKVFSTKGYVPWMLIYMEEIGDRISARKREKYLKSGVGKEFLKLNPL
jgi:putative endonuclease